jgi:hypothetical protein
MVLTKHEKLILMLTSVKRNDNENLMSYSYLQQTTQMENRYADAIILTPLRNA